MISRRRLLATTAGVLAGPLAAATLEAGKMWRIGFLGAETAATNRHFLDAFRQGMRDHGYLEGQTFNIEARWAKGRTHYFQTLAAELVRLAVDVIVAVSTPAVLAAKNQTTTIPIVSVSVDPIGTGLVPSLAQPGGNITGLSLTLGEELAGKWLEVLADIIPEVSRVGVVWNRSNPGNASFLRAVQLSAEQLHARLQLQNVESPDQFEGAFKAMSAARTQAVIVFPDPLTVTHRTVIVDLAAKSRLPAVYGFREFVDAGGLVAYGTNVAAVIRRAATYVDKILKGARPGSLPIEQATQFELVVNLKTARTLGLTIPQSLRLRADELIQ